MFKKIFLTVMLSLSVSCFAESGGSQSKSLIDTNQQTQSSTDPNQQSSQSSQSSLLKKRDSQSPEDSTSEKKPSMVDYCRKHTC